MSRSNVNGTGDAAWRLSVLKGALIAALFCAIGAAGPAATEAPSPNDTGTAEAIGLEDLDALAASFVLVKFHYKRSEEEITGMPEEFSMESLMAASIGGEYEGYIDQKRPQKMIGITVGPDLVMAIDTIIDESYLDYIEVDDMQGGASRAERVAILRHAPALLFKVKEPQKLKMKPAEFADLPVPVGPKTKLYALKMEKEGSDFLLTARRTGQATLIKGRGGKQPVLFSGVSYQAETMDEFSPISAMARGVMGAMGMLTGSPTLLVNADKKPVGIGLVPHLPNEKDASPLWRGQDLMKGERLAFADLKEGKERVKKRFEESLLEIRVTFRQKAEQGFGSIGEMLSGMMTAPGSIPKEMYCYGLPISRRDLFVPKRILRGHAKVIDKITMKIGGKPLEGKFYGAYEDIAGFLVRVDEDLPNYRADLFSKEAPAFVEPLITARARRKFGGKDVKVGYSRVLTEERGYKDILELIPTGGMDVGTYFTDQAGKIRAILVEQRKEDEEKEKFREAQSMFSMPSYMNIVRVYTVGELAEHFSSPRERFDSAIVSLAEEEEKRKMWLGVEFESINRDLAKSLSVEKATKDGTVGLIVSTVYPDSPAAKMGLQSGDILLKIKEVGQGEPIELKAMPDFDFSFDDVGEDIPREIEGMGYRLPAQRPWKARKNLLTALLEAFGEGKSVEVTYVTADRKEATKSFAVAKAPPDFESAAKHKDEDVGLTVKEVTYEVRTALMLPKQLNALVVSKVEEGSPAAVARVKNYELILKINDTPVTGIDAFKKIVGEAKKKRDAEGKVTLRFALRQLGKDRFADLTLEK